MILIYVTYPNKEEAEKIVNHLLDKKLVACGNIFPIESFYLWEGTENSNEFVSILKTSLDKWEGVKEEVKKIHSYDVPCIVKINVEGNGGFERWIEESL